MSHMLNQLAAGPDYSNTTEKFSGLSEKQKVLTVIDEVLDMLGDSPIVLNALHVEKAARSA